MADLSKKTVAELVDLCKAQGLKGYSGKPKAALIALLTATTVATATANQIIHPLRPIRYIDLFCGLGAFHTAFDTIPGRFQCVLACDIDEGARAIYKANYGLEPFGDIRSLDLATMPDFEILCAGFPCQPFSIAGNGEGFEDTVKGNLFFDLLKIIDAKTPPMCILENVKNLKTHDKGTTYKRIEQELTNRGYHFTSKVITASDYGSPQARQRIFMVATKDRPFSIPPPIATSRTVSAILDPSIHRDDLNRDRYDLKEKPERPIRPGKPHILYDLYPVLSDEKQLLLEAAKASLSPEDDPESLEKGGRQGERVYSVDGTGITVCASSGGPGAKTGLYKVGDTIRRLTVTETLKMFGFPDTYKFPNISSEHCLFYLGNSIVVDVVKAFVPVVDTWFTGARV